MVAQPGNKTAVGYGRPPNQGYSDEELIALGEDLLKWIDEQDSNKKSNIVHLSEWYSEVKRIAPSQWNSIIHRPCFLQYYEVAKHWMGKRIMKNEKLSTAYGSRFLGIYFKEVRDHEKEVVEHKIDYELKKKEAATSTPNDPSINIAQDLFKVIESQANMVKELKEEINALKSKADRVIPPSDTSI